MIHDHALMIHYKKCVQKLIHRYVNLLYYQKSVASYTYRPTFVEHFMYL